MTQGHRQQGEDGLGGGGWFGMKEGKGGNWKNCIRINKNKRKTK